MQDCNTKHDYKASLQNIKGKFSARFLLRYASWIDKPTREMTIQYRYDKKEFFNNLFNWQILAPKDFYFQKFYETGQIIKRSECQKSSNKS